MRSENSASVGSAARNGFRLGAALAIVVISASGFLLLLFTEDVAASGSSLGDLSSSGDFLERDAAIYGMLRPGDHAVTTSIEHNSVMRPLRHLESQGLDLTVVQAGPDGRLDPDDVAAALRPDTKLVATVHGSNVTGALVPIETVAVAARERAVPYLVDASQTAGALPIDVAALGIDLLACTGHKGLLGPTGTGALFVGEGLAPLPLMRGGTGSRSDLETQPEFMPDVLESGTMNVAGLAGLAASVQYLLDTGVAAVAAHERKLVTRFLTGATDIEGLTVYGPEAVVDRCGVLCFNVAGLASSDVGMLLDSDYEILSRSGLHCAPGAHQTIGTFPTGTVRFGFSFANTIAEIDESLAALSEIAAWAMESGSGG